MKKVVVIICLLVLVRPVAPLIGYAIQYDYITQVLCINKSNPELECHGKCYLKKQLATASDNEKPISPDKKNNLWEFELTWIFKPENGITFLNPAPQAKLPFHHASLHESDAHFSIFRPPIF